MNSDELYARAVEATARGETVANVREVIENSRFCRDAFDSHVKEERQRIQAASAPRVTLGAIGRQAAARIRAAMTTAETTAGKNQD
jgi:hypothetical protein